MRALYITLFVLSIPGIFLAYIVCWPYFTVSKKKYKQEILKIQNENLFVDKKISINNKFIIYWENEKKKQKNFMRIPLWDISIKHFKKENKKLFSLKKYSYDDTTILGYLAPFLMLVPVLLLLLISHEEHKEKYFHTFGGDKYWEFNPLISR